MRVETANQDQMEQAIKLAKQYDGVFSQHVKVDVPTCIANYTRFVSTGMAIVFVLLDGETVVGGFGALKCPDIHSLDIMAIETFWYVNEDKRGKGMLLKRRFEEWATEQGCDKAVLIHLEDSYPDQLKKVYGRDGYKLVESHYVKELKK